MLAIENNFSIWFDLKYITSESSKDSLSWDDIPDFYQIQDRNSTIALRDISNKIASIRDFE